MLAAIKEWLAPPTFEGDEKKTRHASFLNLTILISLSYLGLTAPVYLFDGIIRPGSGSASFVLFFVALILYYLLRRGKVMLAGIGMMIILFLFTIMIDIINGTVLVPAILVYLFVIIMAGILFEWRGTLLSASICSLAVLGLILAEKAGMLPQHVHTVTLANWITYSGLFGIIGAVSLWGQQTTQQALGRAELEITARHHVEMELRKLTRAVEQSPASIVITDLDGNIEYVNPRFSQVTGYSSDEAIGKNPRFLKNDLTPPGTHIQLWQTITQGKEWHGEFVNRKKDGTSYYESAIISPITDLDGITTNYLAVKEDITERKQAEAALRESEQRYRTLFQQASDGILHLSTDGKVVTVNESFARMHGYSLEEMHGMSLLQDLDTPENAKQIPDRIRRILAGEVLEFESEHYHKDGHVFPLSVSTCLISVGGQQFIQAFHRDITERKQAEAELFASHAELEQRVLERTAELSKSNSALEIASRAKDEFLAIMSHEFRTPLNGILGMAEVLQLPIYGNLSEKQLKAIQTIEKSGYRLNNLLQSILNYSGFQSGKYELRFHLYPLQEICKRSLGKIEKLAADKKQKLHFSSMPESILANVDEAGMGLILDNLLSNAFKFTPEGGSIDLNVVCLPDLHQVRISIRDTGIGIQENDLPRLFQPFQQLDSSLSRMYEGAGMGLALVKLLVNLHGGSVEVESTFGQGSQFTVCLPWEPS